MQSTTRTRRNRLATGIALGLTIAFAGSATAVAAEPAAAAAPTKKLERVAGKGGKKVAPTKKQMAAVKRDLKQAGVQTAAAPEGQKKMTRGVCSISYQRYAAVGTCLNVGGPTGFYTNVFIDWYGDPYGWIYYGWFYS